VPEECELCFGQDPEDLPPECCGMPSCDQWDACLEDSDCVDGYFCQTGCCVPIEPG
jgi:hypothetical protein